MMKRICVIALAIILVAAVFMSLSTSAVTMYIRGDSDNDSKVTILDASWIQRKLGGLSTGKKFYEEAADVDDNGLDINDATWIQRYLSGIGDNPYKINALVDPYELPFIPNN